jgi:large subunit ribosomal protein L20
MRVKTTVATRQKKKKYFRRAKGYYATKKNRWRMTIQQLEKSGRYSYTGRKDKKGEFRRLWIARLNAAVREHGLSYSKFIAGLRKANVLINRKILADLAVSDAVSFKQLTDIAKSGLASPK